jgi:hypothetical protein
MEHCAGKRLVQHFDKRRGRGESEALNGRRRNAKDSRDKGIYSCNAVF